MLKLGFLVIGFCLAFSEAAKTINNHLTSGDIERLQQVFYDGMNSNDIQLIYYGALNYKSITEELRLNTCKKVTDLYKESKLNEFEKNYYLVASYRVLSCPTEINIDIQNNIKSSLSKEFTTTQEMYFSYFATKTLSYPVDDETKLKLAKNIQTILKKDDSLSSLGHGFYVASELDTHGSLISDWVESSFAQADEIDGKLLQFEGGLSITALIFNGALKLATSLNQPIPINEGQAVKFTNYFLSRRSVQLPKGASVLLEALKTITLQKTLAPVCIKLIGNGQLNLESPIVNVKIVDILDRPITPSVSSVTSTITSKPDNTIIVTKANLVSKSSDKTVFALDLTESKLVRGTYEVEVFADNYKQLLKIKILGKVKVASFDIGVGETDSTSAVKRQNVEFPKKLDTDLNADSQQKVVFRAVLVDESSEKPVTVHQAFVRLENKKSKEEIIFVAEQDSIKAYKFEMDVGARSADFGHNTGLYSLEFIVGDASLSNSFRWHVTDILLKFSQEPKVSEKGQTRQQRPEIIHQFREPEKRPARFVSDIFTGLCAAPLLILFILWAKLNANITNFPFSLSAIGFHLGLGAILSLFGVFFWKLNMFETVRYLLPLALVTFFCGNRLLRSIAAHKQSA